METSTIQTESLDKTKLYRPLIEAQANTIFLKNCWALITEMETNTVRKLSWMEHMILVTYIDYRTKQNIPKNQTKISFLQYCQKILIEFENQLFIECKNGPLAEIKSDLHQFGIMELFSHWIELTQIKGLASDELNYSQLYIKIVLALLQWNKCKTYEDIIDLQIKFIHGEIDATPYTSNIINYGQPDIWTEINQMGFITTIFYNGSGFGQLGGLIDKKITNKFIALLFTHFGDKYYAVKNRRICCSQDCLMVYHNLVGGYAANLQSDQTLDYESDVIHFLSGQKKPVCEYMISMKHTSYSQILEKISPKECNPFEFKRYPTIAALLSNKCDNIEITQKQAGSSTIINDVHYILNLIFLPNPKFSSIICQEVLPDL